MFHRRALLFIAMTILAGAAIGTQFNYPPATRGGVTTDFHGVQVPDPYRWLEDIDSPGTRAWVEQENRISGAYLNALPDRADIASRLKKIWNYERWSAPERHGRYWFYTHNDGLQNQAVTFVTTDPKTPGHVLIDPNTLSKDGTVALREVAITADGSLFAYALSDAGSDWQIWHVRNVETGEDLPDVIHWSKAGSGTWRKDASGFYYTSYDAPRDGDALKAANQYQKMYFHKLGTPQAADKLVYTRADDPDWFVGGVVTDDGHYLVIQANHGDEVQNTLLIQDLTKPDAPIVPIIPQPTAVYNFLGNIGTTLYVMTDDGAPRYKVVTISLAEPDPAHWKTVVAEGSDTLDSANLVGGQLVAEYLKDAHSAVRRLTLAGKLLGEVHLAGLGTAGGFHGRLEERETYYTYSGFTTPPSVYHLNLNTGTSTLWKTPKLDGFIPTQYETRQVFFSSKDGTRVPLYIVARKGAKLDGTHPTILYGYGGFNISVQPQFSASVAGWLELGGVYAMANLRGGGEYGRAWHEGGMKTHKQNVFDDFIGAAEYLIAQHWTSPKHLAIRGGSNGGLLVGAVEEERPELFAAAVPQVGVMDMLRFREFTVGKGWESDYGSVDNPDEFHAMLAYSPLQNVKSGVSYPATLVTTADHDDRVYPAHSFKFTAAMQNADPDGNPILIRIETRAGHGAGKPTAKQIEETADIYAFILNATR
jgi:prolyl oligopeptidase